MQESLNRQSSLNKQGSLNRYVSRTPSTERFHSLKLGARVTLVHALPDPRAKDRSVGGTRSQFEITSLLPQQGQRFQYRIKDLATGHERVVQEDQIEQPDTGAAPGL